MKYEQINSCLDPFEHDFIRLVRALSSIRGQPLSQSRYCRLCNYISYPTIERVLNIFDSWDEVLYKAGLIESYDYNRDINSIAQTDIEKIKVKTWTVHESLLFYKKMCGNLITIKKYQSFRSLHPFLVSHSTIINQYGTWSAARNHYGFQSAKHTQEECKQAIQKAFNEIKGNFTQRAYIEWAKQNKQPSISSISKYYPTWNDVLIGLL